MSEKNNPGGIVHALFKSAPNDNSQLYAAAGETHSENYAWRDHPAIVVAHLATIIVIGWAEEKNLTLADCEKAMPEIRNFVTVDDWDRALTAAKLIAHSTGLKILGRKP